MLSLSADDPLAVSAVDAVRRGDCQALSQLLNVHPELASARIGCATEAAQGAPPGRTLLHFATDWPGGFPNGPEIARVLVGAQADVNAAFIGRHAETPLHWAASCDDVAMIDALLDLGANIEAGGGVIGNGTPLADAVAFGQWNAAQRLIERGAQANLWQAAALGLVQRVEELLESKCAPVEEITKAFWCACHGGQLATAQCLGNAGANLNWVGFDELTPLDAARRSGAPAGLIDWLIAQGARSSSTAE